MALNRRRTPSISPRLLAILDEVGTAHAPCELLADICADHARLSLAAVAFGVARRAVAIELRQAPLIRARAHLRAAKLESRVHLIRGDGLTCLRRADTLVIAGVGGDLAAQLLIGSRDCAGARRVIVQPNRHSREVRAWALGAGFRLSNERVIEEGAGDRSLHLLLSFSREAGADPCYGNHPREAELLLGPKLLASEDPPARAFLLGELKRLRKLRNRRPDLEDARLALEARFKQER